MSVENRCLQGTFVLTTPSVAKLTLAQAAPHLVKLFHDSAEAPNHAPVLRLLADLADAARASTLAADGAVLALYKDRGLSVLTVGLRVSAGAAHVLDGLATAVRMPVLLGEKERGFVVHSVNELLGEDVTEMGEDVSDKILAFLGAVSVLAPWHVTVCGPLRDARRALRAPCATEGPAEDHDAEKAEPTAAYAHALLRTLTDALSAKVAHGEGDVPAYATRLLRALYNLHVYAALAPDSADDILPRHFPGTRRTGTAAARFSCAQQLGIRGPAGSLPQRYPSQRRLRAVLVAVFPPIVALPAAACSLVPRTRPPLSTSLHATRVQAAHPGKPRKARFPDVRAGASAQPSLLRSRPPARPQPQPSKFNNDLRSRRLREPHACERRIATNPEHTTAGLAERRTQLRRVI
ncbi:hypothetical protein PsYK624_101870 [Phanerochaete sordida]|uniref:Uncharacterized protein n=1 Tax=Phanerochaete sordida TaxID=48140 RepID=A0A9P3GGS9_9APHY|nr:hypothetical protein PsYK624_101870 [Phanerochaete sordida]